MVLDASAIVAILLNEPEQHRFIRLIEAAPVRQLLAASRVEATSVSPNLRTACRNQVRAPALLSTCFAAPS